MQSGLSAADAHRALADRLSTNSALSDELLPSGERTILVVERDPYAAELAEYFLRTEGYDVHVVRTAVDGQRVIDEQHVDLAIVDLMIGGGAGLRFCQQFGERLAVLAVSALDQHDRALEAGAQAFMHKPLDPLALVSAARDLIGTSAVVRAANRVAPA
jgi:DNA-binding response OmpR family regulator